MCLVFCPAMRPIMLLSTALRCSLWCSTRGANRRMQAAITQYRLPYSGSSEPCVARGFHAC